MTVQTEVDVEITAVCTVRITVRHHTDEDPTDLTKEDKAAALNELTRPLGPEWDVRLDAEKVRS